MDEYKKLNQSPENNNPEINQNPKYSLLFKILFLALALISISLLIVVIVLATQKSDNGSKDDNENPGKENQGNENDGQNGNSQQEEKEKAGYLESWNVLYGDSFENISYVDGDTIENSFKDGSTNYNPEIGNINKGKDYIKNENNIYSLYVPKGAIDKKDKHNGVFLFIHGARERKENIEHLCKRYAKMGYIAATLDHNELYQNDSSSNIFRILDEITCCLNNIKQTLVKNYTLNGDKLELAIGGFSLGSYIAMLYGYSMKKYSPIPIKFIINLAGFVDSDPNYWYKIAENKETLYDIEPETIKIALNNGTLSKLYLSDKNFLIQMNAFLAFEFNNNDIIQMLDESGMSINYDSVKYKELYNKAKHTFISYHINNTEEKELIPILCEYPGNDTNVGVSQYRRLKELQKTKNNLKIDLVYMKNAGHFFLDYESENGVKAMRDIHSMILEYAKTYFTGENYEAEQREKQYAAAGRVEPWNILYGIKLENISYAENGKINNTFGESGANYIEELGNINKGNDYKENKWNKYNLYIPISAINKKDKHTGIIIFLHGTRLTKEDMDYHCSRYAKMGYITATFDFNEYGNNKNTNLFRAIDEVTMGILHIKKTLINEYGFIEDKLELAIGGFSFGSYLTMLYGYSMLDKCPIRIKFLINTSGFLDLDRRYYYKVSKNNVTLENIEPDSIDEGVDNKTLTGVYPNDYNIVSMLNFYIDNKYNTSQINEMLDENQTINHTNEVYQEFYNSSKYCQVSYYINERGKNNTNLLPVLCEYGGNDADVGVGQFRLLRELSNKYNFKIDIVYMRYATHSLMSGTTENGIAAMRDMHIKILEYAKKYFTSDGAELI